LDKLSRKRRFKIALTLADISTVKFAESLGVTRSAIHMVIDGKSPSKRVNKAIDDLIITQFKKAGIEEEVEGVSMFRRIFK